MTTPHTHRVRTLTRAGEPQAVGLLTRAFADDELFSGVFPDPDARHQALPRLFSSWLRGCLTDGVCHATPDLGAVALWETPAREIGVQTELRCGFPVLRSLRHFQRQDRRRYWSMLNRFTALRHKYAPQPRYYLMAVGVEPSRQRFGLGVQVLRPILHRADAEGAATFLETQTEEHAAFYEKLGFETVQFTPREEEPLDVPVWRMIRPATSMS